MKRIISIIFVAFIIILNGTHDALAIYTSQGTITMGLDKYFNYLIDKKYDNSLTVAIVDSGVADIDVLNRKIKDGYDFIDGDNDATNDTSSNSHGTCIASIIAGLTGNLPINIMPVRILEEKNIEINNLVSGIMYAVDNGAEVINLSVGGTVSDCSEIDEAIYYAYENDVSVVVAAGNERKEISDFCPAHNESAITVSSVDNEKNFAKSFSNYGKHIDCCAPGVNLVGYNADGMPQTVSGTSFSTAIISAGIAMLRLEHPEYNAVDIQEKIKSICLDLGEEGFDIYYGHGLPQFNKLIYPVVSIKNQDKLNGKYIDYNSTVIFEAETINKPEKSEICWFINDVATAKGDTYTHINTKENFTIQVKLIANNEIISASDTEKIYVKNSFIDKLKAFIRCVLNIHSVITQ